MYPFFYQYYAIRIEFQVRGPPHVHSFLWVLNQSVLSDSTIDSFIEYLDTVVSANLPCKQQNLELFNLAKNFQIHSHSRTCKKNKNKPCHFHYGHFFTERTIIEKPMKLVTEFEKYEMLKKRENILMQVQDYIDSFLNPNKDSYVENTTIDDVLKLLEIKQDDYYWTLGLSIRF